MRITGLCGGIGAGKSTVAKLMQDRGALIIDVDRLGRQVIEPGGRAFDDVVALFGDDILDQSAPVRTIDRAALASIVFGDPAELDRLEAVSHPAINADLDGLLVKAKNEGHAWVVLDMAVLVESTLGQGLASGLGYDTVVVVEAPETTRIARLVETRGMDPADAANRIASQTSDAERRQVADVVIENNGDLISLASTIDAALPTLTELTASPGHRRLSAGDFMHWEDFEPAVYDLGEYHFTRDEILDFANRFDPQPFHIDEAAAADSPFGGLIASGWHTGSVYMGLYARNFLNHTDSLGSPGVENVRWLAPVRPGDTLRGTVEVLRSQPSASNPTRGTVFFTSELTNQDGTLVYRMEGRGFFGLRSAAQTTAVPTTA